MLDRSLAGFQGLPYDIVFAITEYLDVEDAVSICYTCRRLKENLLEQGHMCQAVLERSAPYSLEAKLAQSGTISYREAVRRFCKRRRSLVAGRPRAAFVLDDASTYRYGDGQIAYLHDGIIRFRDIRSGKASKLYVDDMFKLVQHADRRRLDLLAVKDFVLILGIATLRWLGASKDAVKQYWLHAVDFQTAAEPKHLLLEPIEITYSSLLFVRHTRDYLYFGTHDGSSYAHSHNEWVIQGIALRSDKLFPEERREPTENEKLEGRLCKPIQLKNFAGHDIGRQVAFYIHDGWFYAVTNCSNFEVVEVDWTSFYHCIRFRVDDPELDDSNSRDIYRRQHKEGVLDDRWTDINLQVDERTNGLVIVEARDEYLYGRNGHFRTWYITSIDWEAITVTILPGPAGDLYLPIRDCNSKYTPEQLRMSWQVHSEISHPPYTRTNFILTNTKFQRYNLNAQAFFDVVVDGNCCKEKTGGPCIRLRSGYRHVMPSLSLPSNKLLTNTDNKGKAKLSVEPPDPGYPIESISDHYRYSNVTLWPPQFGVGEDAAIGHDIINKPNYNDHSSIGMPCNLSGDESFVCFLVKEKRAQPDWEGKLVVVCYEADPWATEMDTLHSSGRPPKRKIDILLTESEAVDEHGQERIKEQTQGDVLRQQPVVGASSDYDKDWGDSAGQEAEESTSGNSPFLYTAMEDEDGSLPLHYLKNHDDENIVDAQDMELEDVLEEWSGV